MTSTITPPAVSLPSQHLLGIEGMSQMTMHGLLDRASYFADNLQNDVAPSLKGQTIVNLFFENSTRTRVSFEVAAKKLGASVLNISVAGSSVKKGETMVDTATTLNAMHPDILVVRHHAAGTPQLLAKHVDASIINAGDGRHEHPTQALLDALTIKRRFGHIEGLRIAICGDIANSRVARSNLYLLGGLGADIRFVSPSTLVPPAIADIGVNVYHDMVEGISDCDIVMMLRLQTERMEGRETPSQHEYFNFFGLDKDKLEKAAPKAMIMHPGPMNRGVEIDSAIADDHERSLIQKQVEMGVATRMACLEALAHSSGGQ
ncbi:MAG: aspartate carbamoyltransferase catalytic subunit [Candidatus Puniceispirillaceae bacterium]